MNAPQMLIVVSKTAKTQLGPTDALAEQDTLSMAMDSVVMVRIKLNQNLKT